MAKMMMIGKTGTYLDFEEIVDALEKAEDEENWELADKVKGDLESWDLLRKDQLDEMFPSRSRSRKS